MKKISIVIPCFNEEENVVPMYEAVTEQMSAYDGKYLYEILYIDNFSTDNSRGLLLELAERDRRVKLIFNTKNFGPIRSPHHGLLSATGDAAILICCDFQEPPELIPQFITGWEQGYEIVAGIKSGSKEGLFMGSVRKMYYKIFKAISDTEHIANFTGFGLYGKSFLDVLRSLNDPCPYLRGIVAELGPKRLDVFYVKRNRRAGKSSYSFLKYYDYAMTGITAYSKIPLRIATLIGFGIACISILVSFVYFILKLIFWNQITIGIAPLIIALFFFSAVQLSFIGLVGEYILSINTRVINRPLVIEEKRINFDKD